MIDWSDGRAPTVTDSRAGGGEEEGAGAGGAEEGKGEGGGRP